MSISTIFFNGFFFDNPKPIITPKIKPKSERIDDMSHTPNPTTIAIVVPHDDVADNNNAIVPVLDNHNQVADNNNGNGNMMTSSHRKSLQRSSELVRGVGGMEDDKRRAAINVGGGALGSRARGDLKAAMELCAVGMHGQAQAGIDYLTSSHNSNGESIATSVIVSGGYEDGEDAGNVIVYTGHGGIEMRVIRGFKYEGSVSGKVYDYEGLYKIVEAWFDVGKSGFGVFKFKLVRMVNQVEMGSAVLKFANTLRARPLEARPLGYVSFDISMKKENVPVFLFKDIDNKHEPMYYEYLAMTIFPQFVYHLGVKGGRCSCVSRCTLDCLCLKKNGGQKGVRNRFEVFRSRETGWGVRSLDLIQAGSFICEYTGIVLTKDQAKLFTSTRSPVHDKS
ncbi:histone-lysine N-methyltransferase family member SUVH9-like protein [Tanacetum coccineum]